MSEKSLPFVHDASPEARLWAEVLHRAILDLDDATERPSVLAWLRSREDSPGSFRFVCDVLGYEPEHIRQLAMQRAEGCESLRDAA
ncbi:MAG: hypothetical protein HQL87_10785 [Magnetococcales bacterium]|nr:hypothetical protein [Magnetococcales bacterium]